MNHKVAARGALRKPSTGSGWAASFVIQLRSQLQVRMISTLTHSLTHLLKCVLRAWWIQNHSQSCVARDAYNWTNCNRTISVRANEASSPVSCERIPKLHFLCCLERSNCFSTPCLNAGTCIEEPGGYKCNCKYHFSGINCQGRSRYKLLYRVNHEKGDL
jgi:hypothetical protein